VAAGAAVGFLRAHADRDWNAAVPDLEFTVASVVAHAARVPLWYAVDLTGGPADDAAFDLKVRTDAEPAALVASLDHAAALCATVVDAHPDTARGYHPFGAADPSGFAAMACDEILVHTRDAAAGLGSEFTPDLKLAGEVLARLFPWHAAGGDPWRTLLWANGRLDLPHAPRPRRWRYHSAPLAEWDGTIPTSPV
jgi:hypothetical protein